MSKTKARPHAARYLSPGDIGPRLFTISPAFLIQGLPVPTAVPDPEFLYVDVRGDDRDERATRLVALANWNAAWETGHIRTGWSGLLEQLPADLRAVVEDSRVNWYLIPRERNRYLGYVPLYHLLPRRTLRRAGLRWLGAGQYPTFGVSLVRSRALPDDFETRLGAAFAAYVWPLLDSGSAMHAFSRNEPLRLLAHNLDYWLPAAASVLEDVLRTFARVGYENEEQRAEVARRAATLPEGFTYERPRMGGDLWSGDEEAWEVTRQIVKRADATGKLRAIIDAVRSNRVQDDLTSHWSFAREDFERRLYRKTRQGQGVLRRALRHHARP